MAFLETIVGAGATGLLGNLVSTVFGFINQKQKNKHEAQMKEIDIKAMIEEAKMNIRVTEAKVQGDLEMAEMASFNETIKQNAIDKLSSNVLSKLFDNKWTLPFGVLLAVLFGCVDFLKASIRPGVTLYLVVVLTWVYIQSMQVIEANGGLFGYEMSVELFNEITNTILYLSVSTVLWWFGDRRVAKVMNRSNGWKK
jgi:hypothetical protein